MNQSVSDSVSTVSQSVSLDEIYLSSAEYYTTRRTPWTRIPLVASNFPQLVRIPFSYVLVLCRRRTQEVLSLQLGERTQVDHRGQTQTAEGLTARPLALVA